MPTSLEDQVRLIAKDLGFEDCRFARAKRASHAEEFQEWLEPHGEDLEVITLDEISEEEYEDFIERG